jgi:predicted nuclease with RNAse H fold
LNAVVGIDLAAKQQRDTGICILSSRACLKLVREDEAIFNEIKAAKPKPKLIAIDAPLTMPVGRCCFKQDCKCRTQGKNLRQADKELISKGYRVFPPGFAWMKDLTERGVKLRERLEKYRVKVIEVHPRSSLLALNWNEANVNEYLWKKGYREVKVKNKHEFDALICAITALLYLDGKTIQIGNKEEGQIVIPKPIILSF